jgi:ABC-2 type transport system permease protein
VSALTYTRYEVLRTVRNRLFFVFALVFPLVLFYVVAGSNRHKHLDGIGFPTYYMTGMIAFGSMSAVIAGGSRIALERRVGWTRQLRITPLSTFAYLRAKLLTSYMMAVVSIILLGAAGASLGVSLGAGKWLLMAGLVLVGLIPFAVLGVAMGNLLTPESMGPAQGGLVALFSLLGGAFGPLASSGALHDIAQAIPSYWITQASKTALGGSLWPAKGWIVIAIWTVVMVRLAMRAMQHSSTRA